MTQPNKFRDYLDWFTGYGGNNWEGGKPPVYSPAPVTNTISSAFNRDTVQLMKSGLVPRTIKNRQNPYPDDEEYTSYEEAQSDREKFLYRLSNKLSMAVNQGLMDEREASDKLRVATMALRASGGLGANRYFLYNFGDVVSKANIPWTSGDKGDIWDVTGKKPVSDIDWRSTELSYANELKTQERQKIQTESAIQRATGGYMPFLNAQQAQGVITPEEKSRIVSEINRQIALGVPENDLPFANELKSYQDQYEQRLKQIKQQNEDASKKAATQSEMEWNQKQTSMLMPYTESRYHQQVALNKQFEQQRQDFLGTLSPYSDWIQKFMAERAANPFPVYQQGTRDYAGNRIFDSPEDEARLRAETEMATIESQRQDEEIARNGSYRRFLPDTPSWLTPFTGQKAGVEINPAAGIATPSGQSWAKLLPTQRGMLESLSRFYEDPLAQANAGLGSRAVKGRNFSDTLAEMQSMLPQNPSAGYSWRPARQG